MGNPGKTGYSGNMGNRYMQRIALPQSVFSLPTSVAVSADYCTNQLVCNSSQNKGATKLIIGVKCLAYLRACAQYITPPTVPFGRRCLIVRRLSLQLVLRRYALQSTMKPISIII